MDSQFTILLVEDNPADIRLTEEALTDGKVQHDLHVARDGVEAMAFLRQEEPFPNAPRPDIILLDLNLPRKDGREVLAEVKADPDLARIPVIVLTSSDVDQDLYKTYDLYANGFIVKPVSVDQFFKMIKQIASFWMSIVVLPPNERDR